MRMWMIDPKCLCKKHLLGEHGELHKHHWCFEKEHKMDGRFHPVVQIQPKDMKKRHDELSEEMLRRGYNHLSPYCQPDISHMPIEQQRAVVNKKISIQDLKSRCVECKKRIEKYKEF